MRELLEPGNGIVMLFLIGLNAFLYRCDFFPDATSALNCEDCLRGMVSVSVALLRRKMLRHERDLPNDRMVCCWPNRLHCQCGSPRIGVRPGRIAQSR
jgi:hypothetical protein